MQLNTLLKPGLFVSLCTGILAALDTGAQRRLEGDPGHQEVGALLVDVAVALVALRQAIFFVVVDEPVRRRFDRIEQAVPRFLFANRQGVQLQLVDHDVSEIVEQLAVFL